MALADQESLQTDERSQFLSDVNTILLAARVQRSRYCQNLLYQIFEQRPTVPSLLQLFS
jgi:hypothetical protein